MSNRVVKWVVQWIDEERSFVAARACDSHKEALAFKSKLEAKGVTAFDPMRVVSGDAVTHPIELGSIRRVDDDYFEVSVSQWCPLCKRAHWSVTLLSMGLLADPECSSEVSEVEDVR